MGPLLRRAKSPTPLSFEMAIPAGAASGAAWRPWREGGASCGGGGGRVFGRLGPPHPPLGGGLFFDGSPLTDAVRRAVAGSVFYGETPPPVHLAEFGGNSGLMGAACLVLAAGGSGTWS